MAFRQSVVIPIVKPSDYPLEDFLRGIKQDGYDAVEIWNRGSDFDEKIPFRYTVSNEIAVFGSKANPNVSHKILALVASGRLVLKDLVSHTFPLTRFAEALDTFETRKGGALKVVIEPNGTE